MLLFPFFRRLSYEFFLRTHQALAFLCTITLWWHLRSGSGFNQTCIYVSIGIFSITSLLQLTSILFKNGIFRGDSPKIKIEAIGTSFIMKITVPSRLNVEPGQYIHIWIPSISFWSFLQSHPFMIASYAKGEEYKNEKGEIRFRDEETKRTLTLLVEPRDGLTSKFYRATSGSCRALFSGPHGHRTHLGDFEKIIMVASEFGIVAQLSYLRQLIRGYSSFQARTRRIHLIWQVQSLGRTCSTISK